MIKEILSSNLFILYIKLKERTKKRERKTADDGVTMLSDFFFWSILCFLI